jgi:hypothetical protein
MHATEVWIKAFEIERGIRSASKHMNSKDA